MFTKLIGYLSGVLLITTILQMAATGTIVPSAGAGRNLFAADIFKTVVNGRTQDNVIFSPASIQSCLTLAFIGAEGETAEEMRNGLKLGAVDKNDISKDYGEFIKSVFKSTENGPVFKMANRIFVNEGLDVAPEFNKIATDYFDSQAEHVKFADATAAVSKINSWVEQQTENKITNLLQPDAVNAETSSVLVNAIYFKAKWAQQFSLDSTHKTDFSINPKQKVQVDMMFSNEDYKYGELPDLHATALEMPYENSDLSMLIILPNSVDGLAELEKNLAGVDLNDIASKLYMDDVEVFLPRFKIEFDIDLKQPIEELGMSSMFTSKANFSSLFNTPVPQKISEIKHKAFLDVNEAGSEAAAATFLKIVPMSLNLQQKVFRADHPFVFAIRDSKAVYFAGHLAKL